MATNLQHRGLSKTQRALPHQQVRKEKQMETIQKKHKMRMMARPSPTCQLATNWKSSVQRRKLQTKTAQEEIEEWRVQERFRKKPGPTYRPIAQASDGSQV